VPPLTALGAVLVVVATLHYAIAPSLARFAYAEGVAPLSVAVLRMTLLIPVLLVLLRLTGRRVGLPLARRIEAAGAGVLFLTVSAGYLTAVDRIPINLAVLIFFSFPLIVTVANRLLAREVLALDRLAAVFAGFAGLALALGAGLGELDLVGTAAAFAASLSLSGILLWNARHAPTHSAIVMNLHALWVAVAIGGIAMAFTTPVLPQTVLGWGGMVGAALAYVVAFICFFSAIAMIGSVHTVVLSNIEPLWAILFAAWLWHEPLGAARMAGAGLVLASVLWVSRPQRRTGG